MLNGPAQPPAVLFRQEVHDRVAPFADSFAEKRGRQHRRDENRKRHGAEKSEGYRPGHGPEQPALHALQREDRHVGGDDDGDGVKYRPLYFVAGFPDHLGGGLRSPGVVWRRSWLRWRMMFSTMTTAAIHHHAEIQRAQRKKIGRNVAQIQTDGGKQQRERNGERDDDGGTGHSAETGTGSRVTRSMPSVRLCITVCNVK